MRFTLRQRAMLYTELGKLLGAGFPMENALDTLEHHPLPAACRQVVRGTRENLRQGRSIAQAMQEVPGVELDGVERNLIHAGERSGHLAEVFQNLAAYYERLQESRRALVRGFVYPAFLLHFAVVLLALPNALAGSAAQAWRSAATTLLVAYALAAVLGFGYRALRRRSIHRSDADRFLGSLPIIGRLRRFLALERFAQVFRLYILSAFKPSDAIAAAGEASQSGFLREHSRAISERLANGSERLGDLLLSHRAFPREFAAGMSTAEASGTLDLELQRWSNHYSGRSRDAFAQVETWLPKIVYVGVASYVIWRLVSWYIGYFDSVTDLL